MTETDAKLQATWEAYTAIWRLDDPVAMKAACAKHLSPECRYLDPLTDRRGWDAIVEYVGEFHQQVPGGHFVTTAAFVHHGELLAHWNMVAGDGTVLDRGTSHATFTEDGRLATLSGFFEVPVQP